MVHPSRFGQIATVALLGLLMCASAQAQLVFSSPKNVSNNNINTDSSMTPQVAVDAAGTIHVPAGTIYVVWEDDTLTAPYYQTILFSRSIDGGTTFSPAMSLSNPSGFATNPRICVDSNGGINVVWQDYATPKLNNDVFFSRSTDGGTNFSVPANLSSANDPGDSTFPQVAADASGNIYVVWEGDSIYLGIFFSQSADGGLTFSTTPTNLSPNTTSSMAPQIALGVDGSINVVWQDTLYSKSVVYFSRRVSNAANFSTPPTNISNDSGNSYSPQIAMDSSGNINVIWFDNTPGHFAIMFRRSDNSANFTTPTINVSDDPKLSSQGDCDLPQIGIDTKGNIELAWQHSPSTAVIRQIFSARSTDGGTSFSIPQNISNDLGDAINPWLTVDATGGTNLGWQDTTVLKANVFFSQSLDPGATFSGPENLSKDSGKSSGVQIAADKAGNLNVVWSEDASGSGVNQIQFSRYTNPQAPPPPPPPPPPPIKHPPVANAGADKTVECTGHGCASVTLDGTGSSDPDGRALTDYLWTDEANHVVGTMAIVPVKVGLGTHTFNLTVTDAGGLTSTPATTHVTVQDTTHPTLRVALYPNYLWPPNHKLAQITATVAASDVCDANPKVQLVSITSSEGNHSNDIQAVGGGQVAFGTDVRSFLLRATRNYPSSPRVYTITYRVTDASGNATVASAQVQVSDPSSWYAAKAGAHKRRKEHDRR